MTALHVVVIGAGTLGMNSAALLAEGGARVTVLDAGAIAGASSGRSCGVVGTQFTDPTDIALRQETMRHFRRWRDLGLRFNPIGYLRLARTDAQMQLFADTAPMRADAGFASRLCDRDEISRLVPHMDTTGLAGAVFGPEDGFIDPPELCSLLADLVRDAGGAVRQFTRVQAIERSPAGWRVVTDKGAIDCDRVVNAAGAWAGQIAALAGQSIPIRPERHEAVMIHHDPLPYTMPMVMDLVNGQGTGLNFRHEKPGELLAEIHRADLRPTDPDGYNQECEESSKVYLTELMMDCIPDLPGARMGRGWAGLYPVTPDGRPLIGPADPTEPGFIIAAGAGGYGIQLAPVIGQIAATWVLTGGPGDLGADLTPARDFSAKDLAAAH